MKCPVCKHDLIEYQAAHFKIDICRDGCSGIWFDGGELEKSDDHTDEFPQELLRVRRNASVVIDRSAVRNCPRCSDPLKRVNLNADTMLEIDNCPSCEGTWLDIGELEALRRRSKEDAELSQRLSQFEARVAASRGDSHKSSRIAAVLKILRR